MTPPLLDLLGSVIGETIFETVIARLIRCGALAGVFLAPGPFVPENFIPDDGVDSLRLFFLRALLFDSALLLC